MRIIFFIAIFISAQCIGQSVSDIDQYIENYQELAIAEQLRTGIPASITLAQGIHESGAGMGELALKSNNHFGIKCKNTWTGDKVYHDDDRNGECFRAYASVADSYRDHSDFLKTSKRYSFLFDLDVEDYSGWAYGLKQAGYATNPKYPQILIRIIEENELADFSLEAVKKAEDRNIWTAASKTSISQSAAIPAKQSVYITTGTVTTQKPASGNHLAQGIFKINSCKVLFVEAGTSLRKLAIQRGITFEELLRYNDLHSVDKLAGNQLIFLEEKRKKGNNKIHEVQTAETAWSISQQEGMKLERLLKYNQLKPNAKLKVGQLLYLKKKAPK